MNVELMVGVIGLPTFGMCLEAATDWRLTYEWVILYSLLMTGAMVMRGKATWTKLNGGPR